MRAIASQHAEHAAALELLVAKLAGEHAGWSVHGWSGGMADSVCLIHPGFF